MRCHVHDFSKFIAISFAATLAASAELSAQPPPTGEKPPPVPQAELRDPKACVNARAEVAPDGDVKLRDGERRDRTLSEKLARSDGVICPPPELDPEIRRPAPDVGRTPVIPPPGHDDPTVRPK